MDGIADRCGWKIQEALRSKVQDQCSNRQSTRCTFPALSTRQGISGRGAFTPFSHGLTVQLRWMGNPLCRFQGRLSRVVRMSTLGDVLEK